MTTERELEGSISKSSPDPIDFFHKFVVDGDSSSDAHPPPPPRPSNFKLNLGLSLSLGGFSGIGSKEENAQTRNENEIVSQSTSIPANEEEGLSMIARTCSFPLESEEERRRRKEMQSLKRMEAKRKREEKMRKAKETVKKDENFSLEDGNDVNRENVGGQNCQKKVKNGMVLNGEIGKWVNPVKQGSIGSQGSSEFDGKQKQGLDAARLGNYSDVKHIQPIQSSSNKTTSSPSIQTSPKNPNISSKSIEEQPKRNTSTQPKPNIDRENEKNAMDEMPCVTTREVGPNGQKIEGFLYKYRSGADIRIVCVCHGKFLTPAEFVAHGGGGQVENPLRHIVISSTASGFL